MTERRPTTSKYPWHKSTIYKVIIESIKSNKTKVIMTEKKSKRVYISGPISGLSREEAAKKFKDVHLALEELGYRVFNPMENGLPYDAPTRAHMKRDLNELTNQEDPIDIIFMMRRWPHSSGCKTEHDVAIASGIDVVYEDRLEMLIGGLKNMEMIAVRFS